MLKTKNSIAVVLDDFWMFITRDFKLFIIKRANSSLSKMFGVSTKGHV